jgi:hypothetical protein
VSDATVPPAACVQLVEPRREALQSRIREGFHAPERMIRNQVLRRLEDWKTKMDCCFEASPPMPSV